MISKRGAVRRTWSRDGLGSLAAAAVLLSASPASAGELDGTLVVRGGGGVPEIRVASGGFFEVEVSLVADASVMFNAVLGRLVFTEPGLVLHGYEWASPFETGGATDFSLVGLSLPVAVVPETLEGPGYPIDASDVEFGNFLLAGMAPPGMLLRAIVEVPESMPPGEFVVAMVPDLVTNGFIPLSIGIGGQLVVEVVEPRIGDLDGDTFVAGEDLAILLSAWGPCKGKGPCPADLDGDGVVGGADLGILLQNWGG